jgi:hypothetical protein
MAKYVVLNSGPLGLLTYTQANPLTTERNRWLRPIAESGVSVVVPEIVDYELRRELIRSGQSKGLLRLDSILTLPGVVYLPLTTSIMMRAARL